MHTLHPHSLKTLVKKSKHLEMRPSVRALSHIHRPACCGNMWRHAAANTVRASSALGCARSLSTTSSDACCAASAL
jgi:hypothetical protein